MFHSVGTFERLIQHNLISGASYPERCGAEPDVGPCRAMFPHWYYDSKVGRCRGFTYGGCRGNQNNYVSEQSCMDTCTGEHMAAP